MTDVRTQYDAAQQYLRDGWYPMPLAEGKKFPPPVGYTGYNRKHVTEDDVTEWRNQFHNVALGMPDNVIGIDVDTYQDKPGHESLRRAEGYLGADLPPTWVSSSKDHSQSGIRFYRVPDGVDWSTVAGTLGAAVDDAPGVDIIRPTHRYAVVYPSVHPSGSPYTWVDPWGRACDAPRVDQLPELPAAWLAGLTTRRSSVNQGEPVTPEERTRTLGTFPPGRSDKVDKLLADALGHQDAPPGSHYDSMVADTMALVALAVAGFSGVTDALDQLLGRYVARVSDSRDRYTATGEFWRAVDGAIGKLWTAQPDAERRSRKAPILATDLTLADEYVDRFGSQVRYTIDQGRWMSYDGGKWDRLGGESIARRNVQEMVREVWAYRLHVDQSGGTRREDATEWLHRSSTLSACLDQVRSMREVQAVADTFNVTPTLLNVGNGTVDLVTGMLHEHDPGDMITQQADVNYDPDAECPLFDRFVTEVLPDPEVRGFVQRLFGMSLLGEVRDHVFTVFTGTGRNGKGVLLKIAEATLGDYSVTIHKDLLVQSRFENHGSQLAAFYGRRLAVASELERGSKWDVALVKSLTGGDTISARRLYENEFVFTPSHTIIMSSNHRPTVGEGERAFWNRYIEVPFTQTFEGREDTTLADRIIDNELPGVLQWMLRGLRDYLDHGLGRPDAVVAASRDAREESDPLSRFVHEKLRVTGDPEDKLLTKDVFNAWNAWATTEGSHIKVGNMRYFGRELKGSVSSLEVGKGNLGSAKGVSVVSGVTWVTEEEIDEDQVGIREETPEETLQALDLHKQGKEEIEEIEVSNFCLDGNRGENRDNPPEVSNNPDLFPPISYPLPVTEREGYTELQDAARVEWGDPSPSDVSDRIEVAGYSGSTVTTGLLADGSVNPEYKITSQGERGTEVVAYGEWVRRMRVAGKWVDPEPGFHWEDVA